MRRSLPLICLLVLGVLAGCGGVTGSDRPETRATLLLDFRPNGVHAGIYLARARGFDTAEGVQLRIRAPGTSTDALRQLQTGRAQYAILDIHDLALASERGGDVRGFMALVQRPLAAVIAQPAIRSPRALERARVGVTGLPSDDAVLDSVVRGAGGDPSAVRRTTIGFEAVKALLGRRVQAATAFWNVEGVALKARRPGFREFRVDDFGAPRYPELILCAREQTLEEAPEEARAIVRALQRGYRETRVDPESAVTAMTDRVRGLDRAVVAAQLDAVAPAFQAGARAYGALDPVRLRDWAAWATTRGIFARRPDVEQVFDPAVAARAAEG